MSGVHSVGCNHSIKIQENEYAGKDSKIRKRNIIVVVGGIIYNL